MARIRKYDVRRAVLGAKNMLERNTTGSCDTFEGVLGRGYVYDLHILIRLGEQFLTLRRPASQAKGRAT